MNCKSAALFALLLLAAPCAFAGEGFGMMKKTVNLTRIHPGHQPLERARGRRAAPAEPAGERAPRP
jgi:hypothetical protein